MSFPYSTFSAHLDALAARQPDAPLLIDQDQPISAQALRARSRALAAGLARLGVRPGQRVAVWLPNCAAWVESFLACAHLGALVLAVNTRFRALEVADILGQGRPTGWCTGRVSRASTSRASWRTSRPSTWRAARPDRAGRGRRIAQGRRQADAPLRRPGWRRPIPSPRRGQRRGALHHFRHHVQAQIRAARPTHSAGPRRGGGRGLWL